MRKEIFLNAILNGTTDYAMYAVDAAGCLLHWNASAEQILGLGSTMVGASCAELFTCPDRVSGMPQAELAQALATGRVVACQNLIRTDSTTFWAEGVVTPYVRRRRQPLRIFKDSARCN